MEPVNIHSASGFYTAFMSASGAPAALRRRGPPILSSSMRTCNVTQHTFNIHGIKLKGFIDISKTLCSNDIHRHGNSDDVAEATLHTPLTVARSFLDNKGAQVSEADCTASQVHSCNMPFKYAEQRYNEPSSSRRDKIIRKAKEFH